MTEKINKIKLPKYSSYLTDNDSELLDFFCTQFDCSKAKALSLLLKFWNDNKGKVSNELASISREDLSAKKYDERLATIEQKLATLIYDEQLASLNNRLAILENKLASTETITSNEDNRQLANISNELATNKLTKADISDLVSDTIKEDITEESTLSESPILPLSEVSPQMIPETEKQENKLNKRESEVLGAMRNVEQGTVFTSQSKLIQFLGFDKSDSAVVTKLKPFWENKLFSVKPVGNSNELTRL